MIIVGRVVGRVALLMAAVVVALMWSGVDVSRELYLALRGVLLALGLA